jgi:outer membrane protein assembly factor BamB
VTVRDAASGATRLSLRAGRALLSFPAFDGDGRLMVLDDRGRLLVLDPDIGRVVRRHCTAPTRIDRTRWFPGTSRPRLCP